MTLGRRSDCDIQLPYRVVSGHHLTFQRAGESYRVRDEQSTNGTELDGNLLPPEEWIRLEDGDVIRIVDVVIEVSTSSEEPFVDAFTLAETGTLARKMLGEALEPREQERASFEVVDGPDRGARFPVPDDLDSGAIGPADDALVPLPVDGSADKLADIAFADGSFDLIPAGDAEILVNGERLRETHTLRDGDEIALSGRVLLFDDPLESHLMELESVEKVGDKNTVPEEEVDSPAATPSPPDGGEASLSESESPEAEALATDGATPGAQSAPNWNWFEAILLVLTLLFVLLAAAIVAVTFGVI